MKFAMTYVIITTVVLLFLNFYCAQASQRSSYESKESSMLAKAQSAAQELSRMEVVTRETAGTAVSLMDNLGAIQLIITDASGAAVYDSAESDSVVGGFVLYPELIHALEGNNVFTWIYEDGAVESRAAMPVLYRDTLIGGVYILEYDQRQGQLLDNLQTNILYITLVLEVLVILTSSLFARIFSHRMRKILSSIRVIRSGDYTQTVDLGGRDELSLMGEEFNELSSRLQESEQRRRQFVSDASHELKTPLASIKLLSDSILQNEMDVDTMREFVQDIGNEADRLNRMSQKLLSLTKVDSRVEESSEIVYIGPTMQKVARMLSAVAEVAQVRLQVQILQDCPILILEDDLYQIIFNLAENGIKYNVPGGQLSLILSRREDDAILRIQDSGVGIPKDALGHIFERFYRVDKARSRQTGGSGLGLAIVHDLVLRNRGSIDVSSEEGQGTTFTLEFPVFDPDEEV